MSLTLVDYRRRVAALYAAARVDDDVTAFRAARNALFAYHPSCFYSPRWACPLAPPANAIALAVEAGERIATS